MGETKGSVKSTEVKLCVPCKPHDFQDKQYGVNRRIHNPNGKGDYKCTVCGNIKKG